MSRAQVAQLAARAQLPEQAIEEALQWLVLSWSGEDRAGFERSLQQWLAEDRQHQQAWQHVNRLNGQLGALPSTLAGSSLRAAERVGSRRRLLQGLGVLMLGGASLPVVMRSPYWQAGTADLCTRVGEIRTLTLEEGTQITLNTDTAVNVHFSATERRIQLLHGEVLITTSPDRHASVAQPVRAFSVQTPDGYVHPIGTRFSVRRTDESTQVFVQSGQVVVAGHHTQPLHLSAGQSARFSASQLTPLVHPPSLAWVDGVLVVEQMPLQAFVQELQRYRAGVIRVEPALRDLPLTGRFSLIDTDQALYLLTEILPVQVSFTTRYWVSITAKA